MTGQDLALACAHVCRDKLGLDILVLDLREQSGLADWFVLVTAGSTVHAQSLGRAVAETLKAQGQRTHHIEGQDSGEWILLDYLDVVVHIFISDVRAFYGLERLWGDVPRQVVEPAAES